MPNISWKQYHNTDYFVLKLAITTNNWVSTSFAHGYNFYTFCGYYWFKSKKKGINDRWMYFFSLKTHKNTHFYHLVNFLLKNFILVQSIKFSNLWYSNKVTNVILLTAMWLLVVIKSKVGYRSKAGTIYFHIKSLKIIWVIYRVSQRITKVGTFFLAHPIYD